MIAFDIIVLGLLLGSGMLGFIQGAAQGLMSLASLIMALAIAIFGLQHMTPLVDVRLDPDWAAAPLAFLILFVGSYLALRLVGALVTGGVRQARLLNALDRALGFALGLVRATLFLGACNLAFNAATPEGYAPGWLRGSLFLPLTERSADLLRYMAPRGLDLAGEMAPVVSGAVTGGGEERHEGDTEATRRYEGGTPPDRDNAAETPW